MDMRAIRRDSLLNDAALRWLAQRFAMPTLLATPARLLDSMVLPPPRLAAGTRDALVVLLGADRVLMDREMRARHAGSDAIARLRLHGGDLTRMPEAVLRPSQEAAVLAALKLCGECKVAVPGTVALDLSDMARIDTPDTLSGLVTAQAGLSFTDLQRRLAVQRMTTGPVPDGEADAGWISRIAGGRLTQVRLATPQGLLVWDGERASLADAPGLVTAATVRVQALPALREKRSVLFRDFAGGLTAMRDLARQGLACENLCLWDGAQTEAFAALASLGQPRGLIATLRDFRLRARGFDANAARLSLEFAGRERDIAVARKAVRSLARRLDAMAIGAMTVLPLPALTASLLEHGAALDRLAVRASWSKLPGLYAAGRAALDQAMRQQAPRPGAQGLVLAQVDDADAHGARLVFTWLHARKLDDEVAQAIAVRQAAKTVVAGTETDGLRQEVLRAVRHAVDPNGILTPQD